MTAGELLASALVLAGTALAILGAIGLHRFPDVFARMHAATKPVTLGLACVLVGAALVKGDVPSTVKLLLAAAMQFITAPIAAHMVGRAAYGARQMGPGYQLDELAGSGFRRSRVGEAGNGSHDGRSGGPA
jgi:multicomponent Na+:H+ antiporter subunit G